MATVQGGDAVMLLVKGEEAAMTHYKADATNAPVTGSLVTTCSGGRDFGITGVESRSQIAAIEILYTNSGKVPRSAELRVNRQDGTKIVFPASGENSAPAAVWVQAVLDRPGAQNSLVFSTACGTALEIKGIALQ
jgi:hypothetical protein